MHYSLLREAKIVIFYNGRAFDFDAHANIGASLDFEEYKNNRRTLHRKSNYPVSKITTQNPVSVSLAINLTNNLLETAFFDWLGMENSGIVWSLPYAARAEPIRVDAYIVNTNGVNLYVENCFVSAIDFTLEKQMPLLNIIMEGAKMTKVNDYPAFGSLSQGSVLPYSPLRVTVNDQDLPGALGASVSFQQQCSWRDQRSLHDINSIYTHKRAYVSEMNASATVNLYLTQRFKTDKLINIDTEYNVPLKIFNKFVAINFPSTRISKRLDVSDVYTIAYDIIPMENSENVHITFIGDE